MFCRYSTKVQVVASVIFKLKKFRTIETPHLAGHPSNLSKQGIRGLFREVTKNPVVKMEHQRYCMELVEAARMTISLMKATRWLTVHQKEPICIIPKFISSHEEPLTLKFFFLPTHLFHFINCIIFNSIRSIMCKLKTNQKKRNFEINLSPISNTTQHFYIQADCHFESQTKFSSKHSSTNAYRFIIFTITCPVSP